MNEQDNDFGALRKLLSLKQHEVPPPGYFHDFSDEVISRIRRGDVGNADTLAGRMLAEAPWLLKLIQGFQAKPAYAGVFASALCLLLVAGIVYTDNPGTVPDDLAPAQVSESSSAMMMVSPGLLSQTASSQADMDSSTNPVMSLDPSTSAFGAQNPLFKTVDFSSAH